MIKIKIATEDGIRVTYEDNLSIMHANEVPTRVTSVFTEVTKLLDHEREAEGLMKRLGKM